MSWPPSRKSSCYVLGMRRAIKDRFDAKWRPDKASGCWIWEGAVTGLGYGKFYESGKLRPAHRVAWEIYKGGIPEGLLLDHLCRRKECVNPDHLEPVTVAENTKRRNYEQRLPEVPSLRTPKRKPTLKELFDAKWKRNKRGCWIWQAYVSPQGYGRITTGARPQAAHRVGFQLYVGEIPAGMFLDHLCRNRACVNPAHLEPVTSKENVRRGRVSDLNRQRQLAKTHCKRGHPFAGDNLILTSKQRVCRTCRLMRKRKYNARIPKKGLNLEGLKLGAAASVAARRKSGIWNRWMKA